MSPDIEMEQPEPEPVAPAPKEEDAGSPLRLREGDLPGAINNPSGLDSGGGGALQQMNKTPTVRGDLTSLRLETIELSDWLARDAQLRRAFDLLKTFNIFEGRRGELIGTASAGPAVEEQASVSQ